MSFRQTTIARAVGIAALVVSTSAVHAEAVTADAVVATYADIAAAGYADSLTTASALDEAINGLIESPSDATLQAAREAWLASRIPYQQTEVYRFGNPLVDDWEGKVNAWPLDEGLIDYVDASYGSESEENGLYTANLVANSSMSIDGQEIDARSITPALLGETLHEAGGIESNVATGYHAIEFLLWGQDLNGSEAGAGNRPWSDYAIGDACTNDNCDRRAGYLSAASTLLMTDLEEMATSWAEGGDARTSIVEDDAALSRILTGMGSLSYGELAGERMQLGLMLHDPEEEHDCFADNTAASHFYDGLGIQNVYEGRYTRTDGSVVEGASLRALLAQTDEALAEELSLDLANSVSELGDMLKSQLDGRAYDQLIAEGDAEGNAMVQEAIDALIQQTRGIERTVAALKVDIQIEGSDSLDDPSSVFQ